MPTFQGADTGHLATLVNATGPWASSIRSIGGMTLSIPALDDTDLANATYQSKIRGDLIDIGPIEVECYYEPDSPPPIELTPEIWILSFPKYVAGWATPPLITGTAFITEMSTPELVTNQIMMSTFSLQFDGQTVTPFVFTDHT